MSAFWERVIEGLKLHELWGQFASEAKASYGLYSKDVDWEGIGQECSRFKRGMRSVWALFLAMLKARDKNKVSWSVEF